LPFDAYTLKARIAPALIVLLPLAVTVYAWISPIAQPWILAWVAPAGIGLLVLLAWDTRRAGQRIQRELFERWGGAPTTALLRHADTNLPAPEKLRYRRAIAVLQPDLALPGEADERAAPAAADAAYERAVAWLRAQTMDTRRFPQVGDENANYGFHRNLLALRAYGLISAVIGAVACATLLLLPTTTAMSVGPALFGLIVSGICALVIVLAATEARVKGAALAYAHVLMQAIDGLPAPR
jgi:hypothetical protein